MELNLARLDLLSIRLVVLCADLGALSKAAARANLSVAGDSIESFVACLIRLCKARYVMFRFCRS